MDWEITKHEQQIDSVGNIYQKEGAVIPKACQKCEIPFDAPIGSTELKQSVPNFTCKDCSFENNGAAAAMEHLIENSDHKILKKSKEKTVGFDNIITGNKSIITKLYEDDEVVDIKIECVNCHDSEY